MKALFDPNSHSVAVLRTRPRGLHEALASTIGTEVKHTLNEENEDKDETMFLTSLNSAPGGNYTLNIPDVVVRRIPNPHTKNYSSTPVFIAEASFCEASPHMERNIKRWLNTEPEVQIAFVVKFNETPRFTSLKKLYDNLPEQMVVSATLVPCLLAKCPAHMEIWKRGTDGQVRSCERIYFYDSTKNLEIPNLEIDVGDFGTLSEQPHGRKMEIDWKSWLQRIEVGRADVARERLKQAIANVPGKYKQSDEKERMVTHVNTKAHS